METINIVMMVLVLATLGSLDGSAISVLALTTASVMDTASMAHAIAALDGREMIAHRRCAPTVALDMESASTRPVFASPVTPDSTARC